MTITIDDTTISYDESADRFTRDGIEYAPVAAPATELGARLAAAENMLRRWLAAAHAETHGCGCDNCRDTRTLLSTAPVAPIAPATELGAVFQPRRGERYSFVDSVGFVCFTVWYGNADDERRRAYGNCFRTEAEALAYRDRTELVERAWRIREGIYAEEPACGLDSYHATPWLSAADQILPIDGCGAYSPWRFSRIADHTRFIAALGPDAARLLTLEAS